MIKEIPSELISEPDLFNSLLLTILIKNGFRPNAKKGKHGVSFNIRKVSGPSSFSLDPESYFNNQ